MKKVFGKKYPTYQNFLIWFHQMEVLSEKQNTTEKQKAENPGKILFLQSMCRVPQLMSVLLTEFMSAFDKFMVFVEIDFVVID